MEIAVFTLPTAQGRFRHIGDATSFGEARKMQEQSLPDDLKDAYAGIQDGFPIFYREYLTQALLDRYPQLKDRDEAQ